MHPCVGVGKQLETLHRGYSDFERQRAAEIERAEAEQIKTDKKRAHLQSFVDRFKAKASKAKQAQSRVKAMEKLVVASAVRATSNLDFSIPSQENSTPLVAGTDLFWATAKPRGSRCAYGADPGDRAGLLGANGAGKSTLVKTLVQQIKPLAAPCMRAKTRPLATLLKSNWTYCTLKIRRWAH